MKKQSYANWALVFLFSTILSGCGGEGGANFENDDEGDNPSASRGALLGSKLIKPESGRLKYKVEAYEIIYSSLDTEGKKVSLSGLLSIPKKENNKTSPILSFQHGTRFDNDNRPSNAASKNPISIADLAGVGYITAAPDYMGYGESLGHTKTPPYIHFQSYVNAGVDMLRASKTFLKKKKIAFNKQLFLAGYSEGGYATLAIQKGIQEQFSSEFIVTASAAGAGPYDLRETAKFIAKKVENNKPSFMSYVIKSYNDIYNVNAIDEMYQTQYVEAINTVFDALHTGGQINASLTSHTDQLFKPVFLAALRGETGTHKVIDKIAENNIFDWTPTSPTLLFHGKYDEVVPYLNSEHARDAMIKNGTQNLTFEGCGLDRLGTHVVCALPFIRRAKFFFEDYNPEL